MNPDAKEVRVDSRSRQPYVSNAFLFQS